jgi:hypothetical protein
MKHTIIILLKATDNWVKQSTGKHDLFLNEEIKPIVDKMSKRIHVRFFNSQSFNAHISNYLIIETNSLHDYQDFFYALQETKVFGEYFSPQEIIMGEENRG